MLIKILPSVSCILVSDHNTQILETEMSKTTIDINKQSVRNPRFEHFTYIEKFET